MIWNDLLPLLILAAIYLIFFVAPAITFFFSVFCRKKGRSFREMQGEDSPYAPYFDRMCEGEATMARIGSHRQTIFAKDGTLLAADYYDGGFPDTVILMPGYNTKPLNNFAVIGPSLYAEQLNLLLLHPRAHGDSGGKHSTLGITEGEDLLAWIAYTKDHLSARMVFLYGMSMGCAASAYISDRIPEGQVQGLLLDCGFSSPYRQLYFDMRRRHLPVRLMMPYIRLLGKWILHVDLREDVRSHLARCSIPALFLHGKADQTVPFSEGVANYQACASEKSAVFSPDAGHTLTFLADRENELAVKQFISQIKERNHSL